MKIKFKTRRVYQENVLTAACPEAEALFELLRPRNAIRPNELKWVSKMGFEVEVIGDTRELNHEMMDGELPYEKGEGSLIFNRNNLN